MKKLERMSKAEIKKMNIQILKVIFSIIILIILVWISLTIQKVLIIGKIEEKNTQVNEKDNVYCKVVQKDYDRDIVMEYYKKGDKRMAIVNNGKGIVWKDLKTKEAWWIIPEDKIAIKTSEEHLMFNDIPGIGYWQDTDINQKIIQALTSSLSTKKTEGRKCYIFNTLGNKTWIDKQTLLTVQMTNGTTQIDNKAYAIYSTYEYKFDQVTDTQIARPDLTGYEIKEQ